MLVRLMYASRAAEPVRPDTLNAILRKSTAHNPAIGVTGVLCFSGEIFLQVLEGGRNAVSKRYNRIAADDDFDLVLSLPLVEAVPDREAAQPLRKEPAA